MVATIRSPLVSALALCVAMVFLTGRAEGCSLAYNVFFPVGSTEVSDRGADTLRSFADHVTGRLRVPEDSARRFGCPFPAPGQKVVLVAYANDPEPADHCALSHARGHAVRVRLVLLGIPEADIAVEARGNHQPYARTRPGGWDVQNLVVVVIPVRADAIEAAHPYPRWRDHHDDRCLEVPHRQ